MDIKEVNKFMNEAIEKYDLEGHETVFGGMVWFALCLQDKPATCIDDHIKNNTYSFTTPRFNKNAKDIYDIIKHHSDVIDSKLKDKQPKAEL